MSDEEKDIDIESDEDDDQSVSNTVDTADIESGGQFMTQAEKRAHHNALERKRRDHIKESFHSLRDSVPSLCGEKSSRAQILKQATDYIQFMSKKNSSHQQDIEDLKRQNGLLEQQTRALEKAKAAGTFAAQSSANLDGINLSGKGAISLLRSTSDSDSDTDASSHAPRKKLKI